MKKISSRKLFWLALSLIFIFAFSLLELISYFMLSPAEKKMPTSKILGVIHNQYLEDFARKTGCTFPETIIGHSVLGFVHRQPRFMSDRCQKANVVNNIGIVSGRDLPLVKKLDEFTILIVGGSVAHQFSEFKTKDNAPDFEHYLNKTFFPPNGKKFRVYSGAAGAWAMPNQINMLMMFGERIDAAIAIDGYNEAFPVQAGIRLEQVPTVSFILANKGQKSFQHFYLRTLWKYQLLISNSWLKHSYFFNVSYKVLTQLFQQIIISPEDIKEFSEGNSENLHLSRAEAQEWSLKSLKRYMINFHEVGKINGLMTAEFMQPTRLYGKKLTAQEKAHTEYIQKEIYQRLEKNYKDLESLKYPTISLTDLFAQEYGDIYSDHIHYKNVKGNELMMYAIAGHIEKMWKLKKK